jgi:hypothetical protein
METPSSIPLSGGSVASYFLRSYIVNRSVALGPIVVNSADDADRNVVHCPSCLYFEADNVVPS